MINVRTTIMARSLVTAYDAVLAWICMFAVMHWRFAMEARKVPDNLAERAAFIFMFCCIGVWIITKLSKAVWRYTSLDDLLPLANGVVVISMMTPIILFMMDRAANLPRTVPVIAGVVFYLMLLLSRMVVTAYYKGDIRALFQRDRSVRQRAILIGRAHILHDHLRDKTRGSIFGPYRIVGLIDTGGTLSGRSIRGVPVLGGVDDIGQAVSELKGAVSQSTTLIMVDEAADKTLLNRLIKKAAENGVPLVRSGGGSKDGLTQLEAADLIGRDAKTLDLSPVRQFIGGRHVLITGAGGTIGSELARQVSVLGPARLALVDNSEFNLYSIDLEMAQQDSCVFRSYLGDINNKSHMREIFNHERPHIILHAAALKHVPLSETNPMEAVSTNIGGTKTIIDLATEFETNSFTLVSTDKAVKPTNIMGATKRVAEMLTLSAATQSPTLSACAVRFGNVLASNGSVVPLFEKQISQGGPLTVTHERATRYFMTVDEAAALVLQASALSAMQRKELAAIYVLDMGQPVNIASLARQLIRLRGYVPDRDIKIEYTGLRPGEKLTEELTDTQEDLIRTYVEGVNRFTGKIVDPDSVARRVKRLLLAADERNREGVREALGKLLPDYDPDGAFGRQVPLRIVSSVVAQPLKAADNDRAENQ